MRTNKEQFLNALSGKSDLVFFDYNKNTYYMYHEGNTTVYGWLTLCGFRRSRVIDRFVSLPVEESHHYLSIYIKDIVKGKRILM